MTSAVRTVNHGSASLRVLQELSELVFVPRVQLQRKLGIRKGTLEETLLRLHKSGMIQVHCVAITEAGRAALQSAERRPMNRHRKGL